MQELDCLSAGKGRSSFWGRPMKAEPMESIAEAEVEAEQEEAAVAAPPRDVIAGFDDMPDMDEVRGVASSTFDNPTMMIR